MPPPQSRISGGAHAVEEPESQPPVGDDRWGLHAHRNFNDIVETNALAIPLRVSGPGWAPVGGFIERYTPRGVMREEMPWQHF